MGQWRAEAALGMHPGGETARRDELVDVATRPFEQLRVTPSWGGRLAVIVHGRHWGLSQGRWLNFQSTYTGQINQCSWAV